MEVEVISKETIKPSSPTPPHRRTFRLSLLDQNRDPIYLPVILYYPKRDENFSIIGGDQKHLNQLKDSLSETLTRFYPLAGRVKDRFTVDCNDEGIVFSTARVNCRLARLLTLGQPDLQSLPQLVPDFVKSEQRDSPVQVAVQFNVFSCGGVAISVLVMHKIIDGATVTAFLRCWSSINASKSAAAIYPDFSAASLFPPSESLPADLSFTPEWSLLKEGKGITQRFVFNAPAMSALKAKAASQRVPNPSRVEAVSGFIWKHAMAASRAVLGYKQPSILSRPMNLRSRLVPPLSEFSVGNIFWKVVAHCGGDSVAGEEEEPPISLDGLVGILRTAMEKTREHVAAKLQGDEGCDMLRKFLEGIRESCRSNSNLNPYNISSWCQFALDEVDFGWGKPS